MAVVEGSRVLGLAEESSGRNTRAIALVEQALRSAGLEREHVECIAVGIGPGSYAGIRSAIALAQGWQLACEVRVVGISSAEGMAWRAHSAGFRGDGNVLIDAQRGEFYRARCDFRPEEPVLDPLRLISLADARALSGKLLVSERESLKLFSGAVLMPADAVTLGLLAARREDFISADKLEPIYLRSTSFVKAPPPRIIE